MVHSLARVTALLAALAVASPALAEERPATDTKAQVGIGVSVGAFDIASLELAGRLPTNQVYVPINIGVLRIEPSIGFVTFDQDGGGSGSTVALGVGGFYVMKPARDFNYYAGARIGLDFVNDKNTAGVKGSGTDFRLAVAVGGEWVASPRFSIGAEAQFGRTGYGEIKRAGVVDRPAVSSFYTAGLLFFRFYP
jgi:hypothetical protein